METWQHIADYEQLYQVSDLGRVRNYRTGRVLRPFEQHKVGYLSVALFKRGGRIDHYVQNLVLAAFIGPKPAGLWSLHKDDNKANNNLCNLYYGTPRDNTADSIRNKTKAVGEQHPRARQTDQQVLEVRRLHRAGVSRYSLAKQFNISRTVVYNICSGKNWKHI